jgi:4-amino-4-deoxy-L-arabinose transferase-like glycosyltransferase
MRTIWLGSPLRGASARFGRLVSLGSSGPGPRRLGFVSATLHAARDSRRARSPQTLRHVFCPFLSSRSLANGVEQRYKRRMDAVSERDEEQSKGLSAKKSAAAHPPAQARSGQSTRVWAYGIAAVMFFGMLAKSGIWDPYELDAAEYSRRIAIHLFHAQNLELPDALNVMPTLSDLRMGELPFTSMALGFKLFGLRDWTGRLPLAIWAFAGVVALYELLARLSGRKAALYGSVALATMPIYFMQARTMLGDIVTMSALTMAFSGLTGLLLDRSTAEKDGASASSSKTLQVKLIWFVVAAIGLASGYMCRGLLIGVAIPTLTAGLTWLALSQGSPRSALENAAGAFALFAGICVTYWAVKLYYAALPTAPLMRSLGVVPIAKPGVEVTFDRTIRHIGHAIFPWSAFVPFALGRLFRAPTGLDDEANRRETGLRVALLVGVAVGFAAYAFSAPLTAFVPFAPVALFAGIAALAIVDFDRGAPPSRSITLATFLLAIVLYRDMTLEPARIFSVFEVDKPSFPKSFEDSAKSFMLISTLGFAGLVGIAWFDANGERAPSSLRRWFDELVADARELIDTVASVWNGNLLFGLTVIEAALVGLGAMLFVGTRLGWASTQKLSKNFVEIGQNAWWIAPLLLAFLLLTYVIVRDVFRWFFVRTNWPRGMGVLIAAIFAGAVLSLGYFPALAAQISPKEVLDSYGRLQRPGEPLGLLGVKARAIAYYQRGGEVVPFTDAAQAFEWLTASETRRWLIVRAEDLPKLNSLHRKEKGKNLPVLDARSSQILLVSNDLAGAPNENPLRFTLFDNVPTPAVKADALFEDQLEMLGWEVREKDGTLVDSVVPGRKYHLRSFFRVLKPVTGNWKAFLHIDGFQRRYNGDHAVLDGKYAINLWQPNDVVVDDYVFELEPHFTPGGYTIFMGFFSGDSRFRVMRGSHQDNRVVAGILQVR